MPFVESLRIKFGERTGQPLLESARAHAKWKSVCGLESTSKIDKTLPDNIFMY